jgi:hypothetical protein
VECLGWGNAVGGLSTLGMGGTGRVVTPEDVQRALQGRPGANKPRKR